MSNYLGDEQLDVIFFKHSRLLAKATGKPIQVVYVPSHLFHMLFELFKVSIRGGHFAASVPVRFMCLVASIAFLGGRR